MSVFSDNKFIKEINFNKTSYRIPTKTNYGEIEPRHYIDIINGSDENNGTKEHPWKTMDKFFELLNNGFTDIRCYIVQDGEYIVTKDVISNAVIHITGKTNNIKLTFQNVNNEIAFYNCHLNISNVIISSISNNEPINFHNSDIKFNKVKIQKFDPINFYACFLDSTQSEYTHFYCDNSSLNLSDTVITNCELGGAMIIRRSSFVSIYNTIDFRKSATQQLTDDLIVVERSKVNFFMELPESYPSTPITTGKCIRAISMDLKTTKNIIDSRLKKYASGDWQLKDCCFVVFKTGYIE